MKKYYIAYERKDPYYSAPLWTKSVEGGETETVFQNLTETFSCYWCVADAGPDGRGYPSEAQAEEKRLALLGEG